MSAGCAGRARRRSRDRARSRPTAAGRSRRRRARPPRCTRVADDEAERRLVVRRRPSAAASTGKPIAVVVAERIPPRARRRRSLATIAPNTSLTNARSAGADRKLTEIACRGIAVGPQRLDERRRLVEHRDVGVAEPVDRLLPVADDEDRRRERVGGGAEALRPSSAPAARPAPTARGSCPGTRRPARGGSAPRAGSGSRANSSMSFSSSTARSSTPEKSSSACASSVRWYCCSATAKIRQTPRDITTFRSRRKRADRLGDRPARCCGRGCAMPLPGVVGCRSRSAVKPVPAKLLAARLAVLRQEVARAADRPARGTPPAPSRDLRTRTAVRVCRRTARGCRPRASRTADGATGPSSRNDVEAVAHAARTRRAAAPPPLRTRVAAVRSRGPLCRNRRSACGATSRRSSSAAMPAAQPPLAELREHQRHVIVVARDAAADAQRLIERLADQPRHLGVVGEVEARDRRRPRAETRAAATGRRRRSSRSRCRRAAPSARASAPRRTRDSRLASFSRSMIRCRISAAALRVNVIARM